MVLFIQMVNGQHLYHLSQWMSLIHTVIGCHARYQSAHPKQLRVGRHAQGHFNTPRTGSSRQPSDCQATDLTSGAMPPPLFKLGDLVNMELTRLRRIMQHKYVLNFFEGDNGVAAKKRGL